MARTISEIQDSMVEAAGQQTGLSLSTSKVAEWRLWTYVFALGIYTFELILDRFKNEVNTITNKITPGTTRWYAEMCYRFQNGYELLFDETKAMLYYNKTDPDAQIVKIVAISEDKNRLSIKAAKRDNSGKIVPLSIEERYNFSSYIDAIKFAGVDTNVISTSADRIRYNLEVYFDPAIPNTLVQEHVEKALDNFKASLGFDSMIYKQRFIDAVMDAEGVVTCNLVSLERKGVTDTGFVPVGIYSELESGYFEYAPDCVAMLKSIKELNL